MYLMNRQAAFATFSARFTASTFSVRTCGRHAIFKTYQRYNHSRHIPNLAPKLASTPSACAGVTQAKVLRETGSILVLPSDREIAVGDTISIEYSAPSNLYDPSLESKSFVYWAGGFRDWNGDAEDETLMFPTIRLGDGRFRVSVCVPDFATSIRFGFTDDSGFRWDTNNGEYYHIPVKYQKRINSDGKVETFVAGGEDTSDSKEFTRDLENLSASPPVLKEGNEDTLHKIRGEAALIAEESGLGAIHVNHARDVFTRFDKEWTGKIPIASVSEALAELDFDLSQSRVDELVAKYVVDDKETTMTEFMLIYAELERMDEGIDIV